MLQVFALYLFNLVNVYHIKIAIRTRNMHNVNLNSINEHEQLNYILITMHQLYMDKQ